MTPTNGATDIVNLMKLDGGGQDYTVFDYDDDQELESLIYDEEQEDRDVTHIDYIHDNTENEDEKPRFIFKLQKSIEVWVVNLICDSNLHDLESGPG